MHELSICQALLDQVEQLVREHQATGVAEIYVDIGPLSGVEADLLDQAFSIARAGTVAEHAQLHLARLPVRIRCPACASEHTVEPNQLLCPACENWRTEVIGGDEMLLRRVELLRA